MRDVTDQAEQLRRVGLPRLDPEQNPDLYAELYRIARKVRETNRTVVGLLPTGPNIAVAPLMVELGFALADACEGAVAVVDANTRSPALRGVVGALDKPSKKSGFTITWLEDFLAVATPPEGEVTAGMPLEGLDCLLHEETQGFIHILVDLTGFEEAGEHWGIFEALDGVLLVGHPGQTREQDLLRLANDIPPDIVLGVVLVG